MEPSRKSGPIGARHLCLLLYRGLLASFIIITLGRALGLTLPPLLAIGAALLLVATALPLVKGRTLAIAAMLVAACAALLLSGAPLSGVGAGLTDALTFAAYLPVLQILRVIVGELPAMARARAAFVQLPAQGRDTGTLVLSTGLGSILTTGAHAMLAPLLPHNAPEDERRQMALICLRGICFSAFWSPFAVSVAFGTQYLPGSDGLGHLGMGLAFAAAAFVLAWRLEKGGSLLPGVRAALPILPHCGIAAGATILLVATTEIGKLDAVVVATLPLAVIALLWQAPQMSRSVTQTVWRGLGRGADEVLLIAVALCLGRLIEGSPGLIAALAPLIGGLPVPLVLTAIFVAMIGGGIIGIHPMITAAVLIGVLGQAASGLDGMVMTQAIQSAWGFAVMVSPSGVTLIVATFMFAVPQQRLLLSRNILFVGLGSLGMIISLSLLNAALRLF